jgi:transcriptional regulator with XRE-family HTH domain
MKPLATIEARAEAAGIAIPDLLARAGVSPTTWWRWKSGKYHPRWATLQKIYEQLP